MRKISLKWRIAAACAAVLIIAIVVVHIYLASWVVGYVNGVLAGDLNGYTGSIQSVGIDLYRGSYRANHLVIEKKEGAIPVPFVAIEGVDFSIQWSALFHGRIVSDIVLVRPVVNFAVTKTATQDGTGVDWTRPIKDLMPIDINRVRFVNGSITYQDFDARPQVNVYIRDMSGEVQNLRNVVEADQPLPSSLDIKGSSLGNGALKIHGRMNILKEVPDMNLLLALENADLTAFNNFSEAYAAFDFKSGDFSLYSQLIVKDGQVHGYVKPIAAHLSVDVLKTANPVQVAWDTAVAAILKVFTNPTKDQFATRADLEGNLNDKISANIWTTLGGIVRNAFIQSMSHGFDETGDKDLLNPPPP
jgi:hypothetical protein